MQRLVRGLFQRLVTADGTRAIVEVGELADLGRDPRELRALVDQLVQARLLVLQTRGGDGLTEPGDSPSARSNATVELVHESLITRWPLLRRWLDEGRDDAAFREQLRTAARQWESRGRPEGLLWRGEAMEEARLWRARHDEPLPEREQRYLDAVLALATRATRVRRAAALGTIAFLSLVVALGGVALVHVRSAERRAVAEAGRARAAEAQVKAQLDAVQRAEAEKQRAQTEVRRGKQDLAAVNVQLEEALRKSELEGKKAQDAAARAQTLAASLQKSNAQLEKLLDDARARAEKLERERKKITTELR
jgi:hypothetical protein